MWRSLLLLSFLVLAVGAGCLNSDDPGGKLRDMKGNLPMFPHYATGRGRGRLVKHTPPLGRILDSDFCTWFRGASSRTMPALSGPIDFAAHIFLSADTESVELSPAPCRCARAPLPRRSSPLRPPDVRLPCARVRPRWPSKGDGPNANEVSALAILAASGLASASGPDARREAVGLRLGMSADETLGALEGQYGRNRAGLGSRRRNAFSILGQPAYVGHIFTTYEHGPESFNLQAYLSLPPSPPRILAISRITNYKPSIALDTLKFGAAQNKYGQPSYVSKDGMKFLWAYKGDGSPTKLRPAAVSDAERTLMMPDLGDAAAATLYNRLRPTFLCRRRVLSGLRQGAASERRRLLRQGWSKRGGERHSQLRSTST